MHKKKGDHRIEIRQNARGGAGNITLHHLLEPDQLAPNSRLLCRAVIEPGNSMGYHTHLQEFEFFYILSGIAKVIEDDGEVILYPGDTLYTASDKGHSIEPAGEETLEYLAVIVNH